MTLPQIDHVSFLVEHAQTFFAGEWTTQSQAFQHALLAVCVRLWFESWTVVKGETEGEGARGTSGVARNATLGAWLLKGVFCYNSSNFELGHRATKIFNAVS